MICSWNTYSPEVFALAQHRLARPSAVRRAARRAARSAPARRLHRVLGLSQHRAGRPAGSLMISLSVIVCTRDRLQQLRECLTRIGSLVHPTAGTVEILVVNNGPRHRVPELVAEVAAAHRCRSTISRSLRLASRGEQPGARGGARRGYRVHRRRLPARGRLARSARDGVLPAGRRSAGRAGRAA